MEEPIKALDMGNPYYAGVNINAKIKVKLTERGETILDREVAGTMNMLKNHNMLNFFDDYFPYPKDEAGYTEFQLWDFMRLFGSHFWTGCPSIIEKNEIIFIDEVD